APQRGTHGELHHRPVRLGERNGRKIPYGTQNYEKRDRGNGALRPRDAQRRQDKELAASVIARKDALHEMEVKLEEHCYQLIATGQPMAKDMRVIACTLKVINASMRIGRYGKVIANIVKDISDRPHIARLMS